MGVQALVDLVYDRKLCTYHLGGYKKLEAKHMRYLTIAALATYPCEMFSLELLQDDRFLKRGIELRSLVEQKTRHVAGLCAETWENLAALVDDSLTGSLLQHCTCSAMHRMNAYLHRHSFSLLEQYPLLLCQGVVSQRLATLATEDPEGLDIASQRIQSCVTSSLVSEGKAIMSLQLLRESPCSTGLVEKAHGAGAIVRNYHKRLSPVMLAHRSLLSQAAGAFSRIGEHAKEQKLRLRIEELRCCTIRYCPTQEYCSRLIRKVCGGRRADDPQLAALRQQCIAEHAGRYAKLSAVEKARLQVAAREEHRRRVMENSEKAASSEAELVKMKQARVASGVRLNQTLLLS